MGISETLDTLGSPHLAGFFSYRNNILQNRDWLAGAGGFEPPNGGIIIRYKSQLTRP
jgi:hypothetical protein